jgi:hypothetical protein
MAGGIFGFVLGRGFGMIGSKRASLLLASAGAVVGYIFAQHPGAVIVNRSGLIGGSNS